MFILMRLTGIPLNVGTCMIASIHWAWSSDDTLHFLVRYSREVRVYKEEHAAIRAAAREEFLAALSTAPPWPRGFAILGFSGFVPVRQFGLLSAAGASSRWAADVFMSPVLFARARVVTLWDLIGLSLRRVLIEQSPIFAGLRPWQARRLVLASDLITLKAATRSAGAARTRRSMSCWTARSIARRRRPPRTGRRVRGDVPVGRPRRLRRASPSARRRSWR
jgi:hypothetical protein